MELLVLLSSIIPEDRRQHGTDPACLLAEPSPRELSEFQSARPLSSGTKGLFEAVGWLLAICGFVLSIWPALSMLDPRARAYSPPDYMQFYFVGRLTAKGDIGKIYDRAAYEPL